jgi:uncharacterized protein YggE
MALLITTLAGLLVGGALYAQELALPTIHISSTGKTAAKADMAIVFLSTRSSAPLAADALEQNKKKVADVKARLTALGYKDSQVKFSGNRFAPAGGGMYYPGGQRPTGFDVYNNIYIHLDGADLKNLDGFNTKVSLLLDELSKLGASSVNMPISSFSMGGASIVAFTLKDPGPYEKEAAQQAIEKSRPLAEEIAKRMKVTITGISSVNTTPMGRTSVGGPPNPLDELPHDYLSSSINEVPVRVRVDVRYSYK